MIVRSSTPLKGILMDPKDAAVLKLREAVADQMANLAQAHEMWDATWRDFSLDQWAKTKIAILKAEAECVIANDMIRAYDAKRRG